MKLWIAITYHLFAGRGNPRLSLGVRAAGFLAGLAIAGSLSYRFAPHLNVSYTPAHLAALVCSLSVFGVFAIGLITDSQQRVFLSKLFILNHLPLRVSQIRQAYVYASLPISSIAVVVVSAALLSAFRDAISAPVLWLYCMVGVTGAMLADVLLRITKTHAAFAYGVRIFFVGVSGYLSQALFVSVPQGSGTGYLVAAAGCAALQAIVVSWLVRRPIQTTYGHFHLPVVEGEMSQATALGVRALRTARYLGTNALLGLVLVAVVLLARSPAPFMPLDGAVMGALLLIGTLGQEARSLSRGHYPIELTLYGTLRNWLAGTWLLALINGLVCVDLCLATVLYWAPHGLSVSLLQAGCTGLVFVALGVTAGSLVVPQKRDIFAQCVSTAVYGVLVFWVIKLLAVPAISRLHPLLWAVPIVAVCLFCSYICERLRWHQDIRRKYAVI